MRVHHLYPLLPLALMLATGCSSAQTNSTQGDDSAQWVKSPVFQKAKTIVSGVDYLPFKYKADGCDARALYMSMELASNHIESNAIFAFAQDGYPLIVGPIEWGYHVAPMLNVGSTASKVTPMVLDPSMADTPLTANQWLTDMQRGPSQTDASSRPTIVIVPGSRYAPQGAQQETTYYDQDIPSFDDLPPFQVTDVQSACDVMHKYIDLEAADPNDDVSPDQAAAKQQKLLDRTTSLLAALDGVGKLSGDEKTFSSDECAASVASTDPNANP